MDECHISLIHSLVLAHKPMRILELGVGSGVLTRLMMEACNKNQRGNVLAVDNFFDWHGQCPDHLKDLDIVKASEESFIDAAIAKNTRFDLIISDADHYNTQKWMNKTFSICNKGGIIIYHDVTNTDFPNLGNIIDYVKANGYSHFLFNKNSLPSERCERGLLVIIK